MAVAVAVAVADIDFTLDVVGVIGKGNRAWGFGDKTALTLSRYLRARETHRRTERPELWLAQQGPLIAAAIAK